MNIGPPGPEIMGPGACHRKFGPPRNGPPGPNSSGKIAKKIGPPLTEMVPPHAHFEGTISFTYRDLVPRW